MNVAARTLMTVEQFLDWHPDDEKWELIGGIPVEMMSESNLHETVKTSVVGALTARLKPPSRCRPAADGRQVKIDYHTSYRPDAHINCAPFGDPKAQLVEAPTVVFEVAVTFLRRDMLEKRANYFHHSSVQEVVIVDAEAREVHHFLRDRADPACLSGDDTLTLDSVGVSIPISEFFEWLP